MKGTDMFRHSSKIILSAITFIIVGVSTYFGLQLIRNQAIDACGQMSRVAYKTSDGAEVTQPETNWYTKCLSDKKLK